MDRVVQSSNQLLPQTPLMSPHRSRTRARKSRTRPPSATGAASAVKRGLEPARAAETAAALPRLGKPSLTHSCSSFSLAPAPDENRTSEPEDEIAKHSRRPEQHHALVARQSANSSRKRGRMIADVSQQQQQQQKPQQPVARRLNPYDLRGAPPQSTRTWIPNYLAPFLVVRGVE